MTIVERDELAKSGRSRKLRRGDVLFHAGDETEACATLISGALKIIRTDADGDERILALVHPAGFVGELFRPFESYDVVALTDCNLCVFSGERFDAAIDRYPALAKALLRRTQEDLYAGRELLGLAGGGAATTRVAGALLALAKAASDSPCHPARLFDLCLSRGELANLLGLTIETVSRTIGKLEKANVIRRESTRGIEVIDPARLSALAGGSPV